MPDDGPSSEERDALLAEIDRLRLLVGPIEQSYTDLRAELDAAREAVRDAEAALGALRGEITALRTEVQRARQDQYHLNRLVLRPVLSVRRRLRRPGPDDAA